MIYNKSGRNQNLPILTTFVCIWCVAMFLMIGFSKNPSPQAFSHLGFYSQEQIYREHKFWALVSMAFIHIQPIHLLFNLSWMWSLGGALERAIGPARWIPFVVISAFVSSGLELMIGHSGIGLSGVVYAIFGFGWMTRRRYPEFMRLVNDKTVQLFIGWGLLCVVLTYTGIMDIGNVAHASGLAFGAAVGAFQVNPRARIPTAIALVVLSAGSVLSLNWNPMSVQWVAMKAEAAEKRKNYPEAIRLYRRALDIGANPAYVWYNLVMVYIAMDDRPHFEEALEKLRAADPESAQYFEADDPEDTKKLKDSKNTKF